MEWGDDDPGRDDWIYGWRLWVVFILVALTCILGFLSYDGEEEDKASAGVTYISCGSGYRN